MPNVFHRLLKVRRVATCSATLLIASLPTLAQASRPASTPVHTASSTSRPGTIRGTVKDDTGGVIPGATVTLADAAGSVRTTTTGADGSYSFTGLTGGNYTVAAAYQGLEQSGVVLLSVGASRTPSGDIIMRPATQKQELTVSESTANQLSTDPANNASALSLGKDDLQSLPDDPDDLQADLQALAGPSAGPDGNQIYIDGFTGGRLPPKESIREVRINHNPFSAEFDKLGYGRVQVLTKPGSDRFHGQGYYTISDDVWNSRNPFLSANPPFRTQLFGGNVSGPVGKTASFFVDAERRQIDDNGIVVATVLNPNTLAIQPDNSFASTPQRRTTVSPRLDWQATTNNTFSFRYTYLQNDRLLTGVGGFNLPENGYKQLADEHTAQVVHTYVINAHAINETHFQFARENTSQQAVSTDPTINVGNSFNSGGSGYGAAGFGPTSDIENSYELQNYTSLNYGRHNTKFGFRIRATAVDNYSPKGFNGTYNFFGGTGAHLDAGNQLALDPATGDPALGQITSIQQYQLTEYLLRQGYSANQIRSLGGGASQYSVSAGQPYLGFYQLDYGPFIQDDWRVRPNLTLSLGLRWEAQNNIADSNDWAPRVGFAWSPGGSRGSGRPKTVIRGGWGIFYDRFKTTNVLQAYRYNGLNQANYVISDPDTFPNFIPAANLSLDNASIRHYELDSHLHSPYLMQTAISVERQLFGHTTLSLNYLNARGVHELRTRDINAPIPGTFPFGDTSGISDSNFIGVRPFGNIGDLFNYESTGIFKQNQLIISVNSSAGKWLTLFGRYIYAHANSDTDGIATLPANQYDLHDEFGRSALDVRHALFMGGSISAPWGLRFSPFIVAHTGIPYNITTGTDLYQVGQSASTARPSFATGPENGVLTPFGYLNPAPSFGQSVLPRNYGEAPGFLGLNLRVSKTWGLGSSHFGGHSGGGNSQGRGGDFGGGGRGGHGGGGGMFNDAVTEHRYNLTVSVNARNILNHKNLNTPNGALTSPYFTESTGITGGYGAESTASNQRRLDLQLRFSF